MGLGRRVAASGQPRGAPPWLRGVGGRRGGVGGARRVRPDPGLPGMQTGGRAGAGHLEQPGDVATFGARRNTMKLSEVMSRDVQIANPDDTLTESALRMSDHGVGTLPVCNGRKVLGMVTDRDLVVRGIARHLDAETTQVQRCMSEGVQWCY